MQRGEEIEDAASGEALTRQEGSGARVPCAALDVVSASSFTRREHWNPTTPGIYG
jgi:hypothetical protein